jgi:outer membrane protein OmpA-like peptidoglycan-associated protein
VETQVAGRPEGWQDWLALYGADDPLAAKAQRYLAAMGAPVAAAAPVAPPPTLPTAVSEPVVAASRSPLLLGSGVALIAALALAAYALSGGADVPDDPAPAGLPSASPVASASEVGAATPAPQTDAPADESVTEVEAVPPPAVLADPAPGSAPTCEAGPYVIAITADTSANMAEGEATLGAAAAAYKAGCEGRSIRIRGVANGDAMPLMRRRAAAAASYLSSQGLPRDRIETVVDRARAQGERIVVTFGS